MLRGRLRVLLVVAVPGCVGEGLPLDLAPPPITDAERAACLSMAEEFMRFSTRVPGDPHTQPVMVSSQCEWDVPLGSSMLDSEYGNFRLASSYADAIVVPAKGVAGVPISYFGSNEFPSELGELQIVVGSVVDPRLKTRVRGDTTGPHAELDKTSLEFGEITYEPEAGVRSASYCASDLQYVHIANTGWAPLNISVVGVVDQPSADAPFSVAFIEVGGTLVSRSGPLSVRRGERAEIAVRYRPTIAASETARLEIRHDAQSGVHYVALSGRGEDPALRTETFQQGTRVVMDILWAIDSSGSMQEEHALLVSNLAEFVGYADSVGADYQMAVIEAQELSMGAGIFRSCAPHPPIVHADYAMRSVRDEAFRCMVDVGTEGFATESALGASRLALERAEDVRFDPATNPNAGFLRPEADLTVIAISDEDDQSDLPDDVLLEALFAAKNYERGRVHFHAIAGPVPNTCGNATQAPRYTDLVARTDGVFFEICEPSWRPLMEQLGLDVFRPRFQFALSQPADPDTLRVTVGPLVVLPDPFTGYTYDPERRVVTFHGASVPPRGATIRVDYVPRCPR